MQLAGEILSSLNGMIASPAKSPKLSIQFGAYATFMSFFGLADLPAASGDFRGVVNYASSMVFELFTNANVPSSGIPATEDLNVRFLFHNGTASNTSEPTAYPLFGGQSNEISWTEFQNKLKEFAITSTEQWCNLCGSSTGACAAYAEKKASPQSASGKHGMSPAIGGVIGAFVTLAVVLGISAAVMLIGGFTLVSKKRMGNQAQATNVETKA